MKHVLILALIALVALVPSVAGAAGPADSPGAYTFTADGGLRISTGTSGPARVYLRCATGAATVKFVWDGNPKRVAPVAVNGTAARYPLVGNGVELTIFEFSVDGPDSLDVDLETAVKVDAIW